MRSVLVALLVTSAALLAGCSDDGGHEHETYTCPNGTELHIDELPGHDNATFNPLSHCRGGSSGNTTSQAPNVLPTLQLTVTDDGGNATLVGTLNGNLTFSAAGSADSDGSITGIAVSVTDSNTTRTASLYDATAKAFKSATFKFDRPGVVNVTVALVDDRAGFAVNQSKVYINHPQTLQGANIQAPGGSELGAVCDEGDGGPIVGANYFKPFNFALFPGATLVEATATATGATFPAGGTPSLTICAPDGADGYTAVSDTAEDAVTSNAPLPPPKGTESYRVGVTIGDLPNQNVSVSVVVHYEPQAATPAAE